MINISLFLKYENVHHLETMRKYFDSLHVTAIMNKGNTWNRGERMKTALVLLNDKTSQHRLVMCSTLNRVANYRSLKANLCEGHPSSWMRQVGKKM
jgi:hypothetical protein